MSETRLTAMDMQQWAQESIDPHLGPWDRHVAWMNVVYGRRDPECIHCGQRVWMTLQGFYAGGSWTTDPRHEGPLFGGESLADEGQGCASSPDGEHEAQTTTFARSSQPLGRGRRVRLRVDDQGLLVEVDLTAQQMEALARGEAVAWSARTRRARRRPTPSRR